MSGLYSLEKGTGYSIFGFRQQTIVIGSLTTPWQCDLCYNHENSHPHNL